MIIRQQVRSSGRPQESISLPISFIRTQCRICCLFRRIVLSRNLYYYSSPVRKNLSSKWDRFLPVRYQFDTNHRVNFSTPSCCLSATFRPLAFCVCPLFYTTKNKKKNFATPQLGFLDAIFMRQFSRRCRHRRLLKTANDFARLRTTKRNGRCYSFINQISFHGSRRFIFTGSCSATHGLLLS